MRTTSTLAAVVSEALPATEPATLSTSETRSLRCVHDRTVSGGARSVTPPCWACADSPCWRRGRGRGDRPARLGRGRSAPRPPRRGGDGDRGGRRSQPPRDRSSPPTSTAQPGAVVRRALRYAGGLPCTPCGSRSSSSTRRWSTRRRDRGRSSSRSVLFRDPRTAGPMPGLGIGVVLFVVATAVSSCPLLGRVTATLIPRARRTRGAAAPRPASSSPPAIAVRAILVAVGSTEPFGALSWLPAHLDAFGAAIAIVTLHESGWFAARRHTVRDSRAAWRSPRSRSRHSSPVSPGPCSSPTGATSRSGRVLYVVIAAAVTVVALTIRTIPRRVDDSSSPIAAPGLVLAHEMSFIALARQYRERIDEGALGGLRLVRTVRCRSGCGRRASPPASASRSRPASSCRCDGS